MLKKLELTGEALCEAIITFVKKFGCNDVELIENTNFIIARKSDKFGLFLLTKDGEKTYYNFHYKKISIIIQDKTSIKLLKVIDDNTVEVYDLDKEELVVEPIKGKDVENIYLNLWKIYGSMGNIIKMFYKGKVTTPHEGVLK